MVKSQEYDRRNFAGFYDYLGKPINPLGYVREGSTVNELKFHRISHA